ncbi:MAG: hypothetical protein ACRD3K_04555, partial [Edaphobacter sp.]
MRGGGIKQLADELYAAEIRVLEIKVRFRILPFVLLIFLVCGKPSKSTSMGTHKDNSAGNCRDWCGCDRMAL